MLELLSNWKQLELSRRIEVMHKRNSRQNFSNYYLKMAWWFYYFSKSFRTFYKCMYTHSEKHIQIFMICFYINKTKDLLDLLQVDLFFNLLATNSNILAWRIPGTGEPGGLPSLGSHRVGHDWSDLAAAAAVHTDLEFALFFKLRCWQTMASGPNLAPSLFL